MKCNTNKNNRIIIYTLTPKSKVKAYQFPVIVDHRKTSDSVLHEKLYSCSHTFRSIRKIVRPQNQNSTSKKASL